MEAAHSYAESPALGVGEEDEVSGLGQESEEFREDNVHLEVNQHSMHTGVRITFSSCLLGSCLCQAASIIRRETCSNAKY